jgi:hypothetical protein
MPLILSCAGFFTDLDGPSCEPVRYAHEVRGLPQAHRLDVYLTPPEVSGDDPGLIRASPAGRDSSVVLAVQDLFGEEGEAGRVPRLEALVGDEASPGQGEDLDYPGFGRGGDNDLDALSANDGARKADALDASDEVPQAGGRLKLEFTREPSALPDQRVEVLLAAFATPPSPRRRALISPITSTRYSSSPIPRHGPQRPIWP